MYHSTCIALNHLGPPVAGISNAIQLGLVISGVVHFRTLVTLTLTIPGNSYPNLTLTLNLSLT